MPKRHKQTIVSWTCNVCYKEHSTEKQAVACENQGIALPEFKNLDLVTITFKDGKGIMGQIIDYGPDDDDERQNPHWFPDCYGVNITYRDYNPWKYKPRDNNPLRMMGHSGFPRKMMELYIAEGSVCPICQSPNISRTTEYFYLPYCQLWSIDIDGVEVCNCGNCNLRFFNKKQSNLVNQKIRAKLQGVKLAKPAKRRR